MAGRRTRATSGPSGLGKKPRGRGQTDVDRSMELVDLREWGGGVNYCF